MKKDIMKFASMLLVLLLSSCMYKSPLKINRSNLIGFWKLEEYCDITLNSDSTFMMNNVPRYFWNKDFNSARNITIYGREIFIESEEDDYKIKFSVFGTTQSLYKSFTANVKYNNFIFARDSFSMKLNAQLNYYPSRENKTKD